jgi:hypothetical protein
MESGCPPTSFDRQRRVLAQTHTFEATPWASINTRLIASNGQVIPVEVTGTVGLQDPEVNAIIHDIRRGHEQDILSSC